MVGENGMRKPAYPGRGGWLTELRDNCLHYVATVVG